MSQFSGKCDLFDHIVMEKLRTKEGSDKKEDTEKAKVLYGDIMECFRIFKAKTGGILHRHIHIDVDSWNQRFVATRCPEFSFREIKTKISDKRFKKGEKEEVTYLYTYFGKEYTEKELHKHGGVYIDDPIYFDTILELVPYFPYIVTMCSCDNEKETVYISKESYAEHEHEKMLQSGYDSKTIHYYRKDLADIYFKICKEYLCYNLEERTKIVSIKDLLKYDDSNYCLKIDTGVDENHAIEYVWTDNKNHSHWTSPKLVDRNTIVLSKQDVECYLFADIKTDNVKLKYVEYCDFPLYF